MSFLSQSSPPGGSLLPSMASSITSQLHVTTSAAGKPMLAPVTEVLSFDTGFFMALKAVQLLREHQAAGPDGVAPLVVVALGGPSGAGKTVFAEKLGNMLPGSSLISMDCYNDGTKCIDDNFDDERLTDYDTLLANLAELRAGRAAEVPIYCYKASRRIGFRTVAPPTSRVLLLEGIYALSGMLRPHVDLRIAITGGVHKDLIKRVLRDVTRTKQSPREIIQQISETVYPMYKAYIEPDLQTAQLRIRNEWNPFTGLVQQPTYTIKQALPLSAWAPGDSAAESGGDATADVARIARTLGCAVPPTSAWSTTVDTYLLPPHEQAPTCATWLRLRACDGRYFLIFDEFLSDGPFVISPGVRYEVGIRVLGGLMALGYTIGCTLRRRTISFDEDHCGTVVKIDIIHSSETDGSGGGSASGTVAAPVAACFVQVQGRLRAAVEETARRMGMEAHKCIPMSYIQQVQQHQLAGVQLRDNSSGGGGGGNSTAGATANGPVTPPGLQGRPDWLNMAETTQSPVVYDSGTGATPVARMTALCARVDALATQAAAKQQLSGGAAPHGVVSAAPAGSLEALMQAQTALALEVGRLHSGQGHRALLAVGAAALGAGVLLGAALVRATRT
jgi:uridine kinase